MKRDTMLVAAVAVVALFLFFNPLQLWKGAGRGARRPGLPQSSLAQLVAFAESHHKAPEDYVLGCFASHDIVFLGEFYKIRQNVQLVSSLIPRLYAAGVRNLGIEYALSDDQRDIDSLVTADAWDETKARAIIFDWIVTWGFQEYVDIFKTAWQLNHGLPRGSRPFRVLGLSVRQNWEYLTTEKDAQDPKVVARVFANGVPDAHMAEVIDRELIEKGHKGLIVCGMQHAFTGFRSTEYQKSAEKLRLSETRRAGNIVYEKIGARAFSIALHAPWPDAGSSTGLTWAADGAIDSLIANLPPGDRYAGFDAAGTPLGALPVTTGTFARDARAGTTLTLADLFDGYVIQGPLAGYTVVTPIAGFVKPADAARALRDFPGAKPPSLTAEQANQAIADDAAAVQKLLGQFR
ncbi:MAG: hypothetical protein ABSG38_13310 [Spirochaetia bacterium]|jgi:hypothetical protein